MAFFGLFRGVPICSKKQDFGQFWPFLGVFCLEKQGFTKRKKTDEWSHSKSDHQTGKPQSKVITLKCIMIDMGTHELQNRGENKTFIQQQWIENWKLWRIKLYKPEVRFAAEFFKKRNSGRKCDQKSKSNLKTPLFSI